MLKTHKKCTVCKAIETDKKLMKDIFNTNFYLKDTNLTLSDVAQKYPKLGYTSIINHAKKHQFMNDSDFQKRTLQTIKKKHKTLAKEGTIENSDVWNTVISKGIDDLNEGRVVIRPVDLLKAVKDKSDYELKTKDQALAYTEMMWHFASGESNESKNYDRRIIEGQTAEYYDATKGPSGDSDEGEDRPDTLHYPPTWDALT